jgi:hypothetical protein
MMMQISRPKFFSIGVCLILGLMQTVQAETRVLFVGNSVSYYHGLPYVFSEVASDLYGVEVHVDTWAQAGGWLGQALSHEDVVSELSADPYDVVVLQESGGLLMCGSSDPNGWSDICQVSLRAHEGIVSAAARGEALTMLLGTNQMRPEATLALTEGELGMQSAAEIDVHVPYGRLLMEGQGSFPDLEWLDADGGHPGPGAVLLMACRIAEEAFDSERGSLASLEYFEPPRTPNPSLSYQSLTIGTQAFLTETAPALSAGDIESVLEVCEY